MPRSRSPAIGQHASSKPVRKTRAVDATIGGVVRGASDPSARPSEFPEAYLTACRSPIRRALDESSNLCSGSHTKSGSSRRRSRMEGRRCSFLRFRTVSALLDVSQLLRVPDFGFTDVLRHHDGYSALPRPEIFLERPQKDVSRRRPSCLRLIFETRPLVYG